MFLEEAWCCFCDNKRPSRPGVIAHEWHTRIEKGYALYIGVYIYIYIHFWVHSCQNNHGVVVLCCSFCVLHMGSYYYLSLFYILPVYDGLPQMLWMKKFLEEQEVIVKETMVYQDNMSSILFKKKGNSPLVRGPNTRISNISTLQSMCKTKHSQWSIVLQGTC